MIWAIPNIPEYMIRVIPEIWAIPNMCHSNVRNQTRLIGGSVVSGYYILHSSVLDDYQLVKHSVWDFAGELIDITPYDDHREFTCFIPRGLAPKNVFLSEYSNVINNSSLMQKETGMTYYVYGLFDPREERPFYVGKGHDDRAEWHFGEARARAYANRTDKKIRDRKQDKINAIRAAGYEPVIRYFAENILDEKTAYAYEDKLISHYGRSGIDDGGVLMNICLGANPPNHAGKTYDEIYGPVEAQRQREKRTAHQLSVGGYGPRKHKETTKAKQAAKTLERNLAKIPTKEEYLLCLQEFHNHFDGKLSHSRLQYWLALCGFPKSTRNQYWFPGQTLIDVCVEKFKSAKIHEKQLWFFHPETKKVIRISDWKLEAGIEKVPNGYIPGRK